MPVHKHTRDMISAEPSVSATPAGTFKTIGGVTGGGTISARLDRLPATRSVWKLVICSAWLLFRTLRPAVHGLCRAGLVQERHPHADDTPACLVPRASRVSSRRCSRAVHRHARVRLCSPTGSGGARSSPVRCSGTRPRTSSWRFRHGVRLNLWRFIAGLGIGVELVTIGTYLSELVPKHIRGRAFALRTGGRLLGRSGRRLSCRTCSCRAPARYRRLALGRADRRARRAVRLVDPAESAGKSALARAARPRRGSRPVMTALEARVAGGIRPSRCRRLRRRNRSRAQGALPRDVGAALSEAHDDDDHLQHASRPSATMASPTGCRRC